jgi:peptidylprolyl isomerase
MIRNSRFLLLAALAFFAAPALAQIHPSMAEVLAASRPSDWRPLDPDNTLYVELPAGRVVIELAPAFAPLHVRQYQNPGRAATISMACPYMSGCKTITWRNGAIPTISHPCRPASARPHRNSIRRCPRRMPFTRLPDGDVYAPEVGFSDGFPVRARRRCIAHGWRTATEWWALGAILDVESGSGAELYVVIGHAPRHLDRNVALVGRS